MRIIGAILLLLAASFSLPGMALAGAGGTVAEVQGNRVKIEADFEFLPSKGDRIEVYVDVPEVGPAVVATAIVTGIEGDHVLAEIERSIGNVKPGQKVRSVGGDAEGPATDDAAAPGPKEAKSDLELLQGTWENVVTLQNGKSVEQFIGVRLVVAGNKLAWERMGSNHDQTIPATFALDPTKDPKHFDWTPDGKTTVHKRIYSLDGDMLKMSTNFGANPRPVTFDGGRWQFVLKRVRSAAAPAAEEVGASRPAPSRATLERAKAGDAESQTRLGRLYQDGQGVPQNFDEALRWYRKAAAQGHPAAQHYLGLMYSKGLGVERDEVEAAKWIRAAAENGLPKAQNELGWRYLFGKGVPQNDTEALKWCWKAAEGGNAKAQANIGLAYFHGKGVPQSEREAYKWYLKAAKQGFANGQYSLGWMVAEGRGVKRDYDVAMQWLKLAADQNLPEAQNYIGWMHHNGMGVPQNHTEAVKWYRKAAAQGLQVAKENLRALGVSP